MAEGKLKTMNLAGAEGILRRERRGNNDLYVHLSRLQVRPGDELGEPHERYRLAFEAESRPLDLAMTPHSLYQLTSLAGVPAGFPERIPLSVGLATLRSCLTLAIEARDDPMLLLRLGGGQSHARALLPASFLRYDDRDLFLDIKTALAAQDLRVTNLLIHDDVLHIRIVTRESLDLGSERETDPARPGIDIRSSETGRFPLELRRVLVRVVCWNGVTTATSDQETISRRKIGISREEMHSVVRNGLEESIGWSRQSAERLRNDRARTVRDPIEEMERVFQTYRLGSVRSTAGRLLRDQLNQQRDLFGLSRFQFIQAFTATAQALEPQHRSRWEDGLGAYLFEE